MKIWVDLFAAPDPFFFRPIINRMRSEGHEVSITLREYGETSDTARQCGLTVEMIGRHGGVRLRDRLRCSSARVLQLVGFARKLLPDVAVSFNSYSQAIAAKMLGIRFVTFMDYEYHPLNHLAFRLASQVVVPEGYDDAMLARQTAHAKKVQHFHGLKEDISVLGFEPDASFLASLAALGVNGSNILVAMRPPPKGSSYHRFENDLFYDLVRFVAAQPDVKIIYLPRHQSQAERVKSYNLPNLIVPPFVLDGYQLVYFSDLLISAGGSMNREAAALGTPAYTTFKGKMAGVDKRLIESGLLTEIGSLQEFEKVVFRKKKLRGRGRGNPALVDLFLQLICSGSDRGGGRRGSS